MAKRFLAGKKDQVFKYVVEESPLSPRRRAQQEQNKRRQAVNALKAVDDQRRAAEILSIERQTVFEQLSAETAEERELKQKAYLVYSPRFNAIIGATIVLNAIAIGVEVDVGHGDAVGDRIPFLVADIIFGLVFFVEMGMRMSAEYWDYFLDAWNILDFHLVVLGFVDVVVSVIFQDSADFKILTAFRIARMLRLVRNVRLLRMFRELWILVRGFVDSLSSIGWVMFLLVIIIYACSVLCTQIIGRSEAYAYAWPHVQIYFGDIGRTMLSLFQVTTRDNWAATVIRPVLEVSTVIGIILILMMLLCAYAVLNVIVGIIVERTLQVAHENDKHVKERVEDCEHLIMMSMAKEFKEADTTGDGSLDYHEFMRAVHKKEFRTKLRLIDVPEQEAEELFYLMDVDKSGTITADEFITGIRRIKGTARGRDMIQLNSFVQRAGARVQSLHDRADTMIDRADKLIERLDSVWSMAEVELHERGLAQERMTHLARKMTDKQRMMGHADRNRHRWYRPFLREEEQRK